MRDINVRDLLDLVGSDVDNPQEKLSQLYLWKYDYAMTAAKATTAAGASFLVGLFIALLQAKPHLATTEVVTGFIGAGVLIIIGIFQYIRLRAVSRQFIAAHYLLSEVVRMRPFLQLYRSGTGK